MRSPVFESVNEHRRSPLRPRRSAATVRDFARRASGLAAPRLHPQPADLSSARLRRNRRAGTARGDHSGPPRRPRNRGLGR